jgi:hypothetical protein
MRHQGPAIDHATLRNPQTSSLPVELDLHLLQTSHPTCMAMDLYSTMLLGYNHPSASHFHLHQISLTYIKNQKIALDKFTGKTNSLNGKIYGFL